MARRTTRRFSVVGAVVASLTLAGCGGGVTDDSAAVDSIVAGTVETSDSVSPTAPGSGEVELEADGSIGRPSAAPAGSARVDLVGADVVPEARIESNLLPDVVVDDLSNDRKVNFKNLVPQDKPILLWMWAPH